MAIVQSSSSPAGPSRPPATHRDLHKLNPDIIIIGAGIAGTALAYSLSTTQKRRVLLLERDLAEPDRIVGELLQPGGVAALTKLGLSHCLEGIDATPVEGYCVVNGGEIVGVPYPELDKMAGGNGQMSADEQSPLAQGTEDWPVASKSGLKEGRSFHHGRLIASLRNACLTAPTDNLTVMEATVRDLIYCDHTNRVIGVTAAFKQPKAAPQDGEGDAAQAEEKETVVRNVYAPITIVADGCFSKFRNTPGAKLPTPQTRSHFVGVIIKDTDLPMKYKGTVCLTPEGPVLLYQIGNKAEEIRMLVDVKGKLPNVANGSLKKHILEKYLPHLPSSLHEPIRHALDTQRLRTMPNSFLPPSMQGRHHTPAGLIMVGDAWNMRHPLTGGGMTVAFNDAVLLTEYLGVERLGEGREALEDWSKISEGLREWFWRRKNLAGVVNVLSMALYDLFGGSEEPDLEVLREGCFRYFQLGGECIAGPVGLLSAVTPKPLLLFYHFFSVAFYSIYILFTTGRPPAHGEKAVKPTLLDVPGLMLFSCKVFYTACVVLLPMIFTEFRL